MTEYINLKIPVQLSGIIDGLIKSKEFSSRAEYVKMLIRIDLQKRGLMK